MKKENHFYKKFAELLSDKCSSFARRSRFIIKKSQEQNTSTETHPGSAEFSRIISQLQNEGTIHGSTDDSQRPSEGQSRTSFFSMPSLTGTLRYFTQPFSSEFVPTEDSSKHVDLKSVEPKLQDVDLGGKLPDTVTLRQEGIVSAEQTDRALEELNQIIKEKGAVLNAVLDALESKRLGSITFLPETRPFLDAMVRLHEFSRMVEQGNIRFTDQHIRDAQLLTLLALYRRMRTENDPNLPRRLLEIITSDSPNLQETDIRNILEAFQNMGFRDLDISPPAPSPVFEEEEEIPEPFTAEPEEPVQPPETPPVQSEDVIRKIISLFKTLSPVSQVAVLVGVPLTIAGLLSIGFNRSAGWSFGATTLGALLFALGATDVLSRIRIKTQPTQQVPTTQTEEAKELEEQPPAPSEETQPEGQLAEA